MSEFKQKFKVVSYPLQPNPKMFYCSSSDEIRQTYGLFMYDLKYIYDVWSSYSERASAGWLMHDKDGVERAFKIKLKPIDERKNEEMTVKNKKKTSQ